MMFYHLNQIHWLLNHIGHPFRLCQSNKQSGPYSVSLRKPVTGKWEMILCNRFRLQTMYLCLKVSVFVKHQVPGNVSWDCSECQGHKVVNDDVI